MRSFVGVALHLNRYILKELFYSDHILVKNNYRKNTPKPNAWRKNNYRL